MVFEKNHDVGGTWWENTVSGLPRRQPQPQLQLLLRPTPRLADALLHPGRPRRLLPRLRRRARPARALRFETEVESATWSTTPATAGRCAPAAPDGAADDVAVDAVISAMRPAQPARTCPRSTGSDTFAGPAFHSARWPADLDLAGQAGRRHRHRRQRRAVHPDHRRAGRRRCIVFQRTPAWFAPTARLPRRRRGRPAVAVPARAVLQRVEPLLDLLGDGRRPARLRHRRPGVGAEGPRGQRR